MTFNSGHAARDEVVAACRARAEAAEASLAKAVEVLRPFAADKLPSTKRTERDFDEHGLRRMMSPMEIAAKAARDFLNTIGAGT